jgi:hypothetical protein
MTNELDKQDERMICALSVAERQVLQQKLRELPETSPSRAVWKRIETQARAEGLFAARRVPAPLKWIGGGAIAAAVALFALRMPMVPQPGASVNVFPTEPDYTETVGESAGVAGLRAVNALMVRSQQLESDLRAMPDQPQLARAGTVATINDIEDRIAAIDYILNDSRNQLTPGESETYWRERVRLMNSLLQLRYAQAQRLAF